MYMLIWVAPALAILLFFALRDKHPVFACATIWADAPMGRVWEILADPNRWADWNPEIKRMQVSGRVGVGAVFVWKAGGITIKSKITEYQPKSRIAWEGKAPGIDAYHVWELNSSGNATHIYTEEKFTGLLPWLMPGTMRKGLGKALKHGVGVLKTAAENPRPEQSFPPGEDGSAE